MTCLLRAGLFAPDGESLRGPNASRSSLIVTPKAKPSSFITAKIPKERRAVHAPGGQDLAVGREGETQNFPSVSSKTLAFLAGGHVPQGDRVVAQFRGGEGFAVGRKRQGIHP